MIPHKGDQPGCGTRVWRRSPSWTFQLKDGAVQSYRAKVKISFKYEAGD